MRLLLCSVSLIFLLLSGAANAQMGTGWVPYSPPSSIQLDGSDGIESYPGTSTTLSNEGASFTDQDGIETFALHDPISNRAERRMQNTYQTGRRQFEGEVRVSPPTNDESVMQVFGGNSGATTQMIRAYNEGGGTLRKVPGSVLLAQNIHGTWVKVNVIHDIGANVVTTYVNGRLLATGDGEAVNAGNDGWYHKYGCYGTLRTGSAKVEWRNVRHFRDGNSPAPTGDGGSPNGGLDASGADGAAADPDAGVPSTDAAPEVDASGPTGGAGGSAGSGGGPAPGPGTGGSAGRGGRGGAGGAAGASPPISDPPAGSGCSCRASGPPSGTETGLVLLLAWLLVKRRRR